MRWADLPPDRGRADSDPPGLRKSQWEQLRARLERLPAGHPSSPGGADFDDNAGQDDSGEGERRGRERPGEAGQPSARRRGGQGAGRPGRRGGQDPAVRPGGQHRGRLPAAGGAGWPGHYQPWFAAGERADPWFAAGERADPWFTQGPGSQ